MAKNFQIKIVYNNLPKIAARLPEAVSEIVRKTAKDVEAGAKVVVPVDTGTLKRSIKTDMVSRTQAIVSANTDYAVYVEYGHEKRNHKGRVEERPFMRPAAEKAKPGFLAALRRLEERLR